MAAREPHILITQTDYEKLMARFEGADSDEALPLFEELSRASIIPEKYVPPNTVTMNSHVRFKDLDTGEESEATIVFPDEANSAERKISVLAPVGTALLGLSTGEKIRWPMPNGTYRTLEVISIDHRRETSEPTMAE